jgi:hypothetical protein
MEIVRHLDAPSARRRCQAGKRIHAAYPGALRPFRRRLEMRHLGRGMDAGIGAAGAGHAHRRAGDLRQRTFQRHPGRCCPAGWVCQPAKAAAFVFQAERDFHERPFRRMRQRQKSVPPARRHRRRVRRLPPGFSGGRGPRSTWPLPPAIRRQCRPGGACSDVAQHQHQPDSATRLRSMSQAGQSGQHQPVQCRSASPSTPVLSQQQRQSSPAPPAGEGQMLDAEPQAFPGRAQGRRAPAGDTCPGVARAKTAAAAKRISQRARLRSRPSRARRKPGRQRRGHAGHWPAASAARSAAEL